MISYAQNFEDVMLRRVFKDRKNGFYIDVGAMDPALASVTKFFYDDGWSGINIEPNEWFYNKLMEDRPRDINLNLAVGEREESRTLYVFEQNGNSTFEESGRDRFVEQGQDAKQKTVRVTTLAAVCREYVKRPIDFLKVDCEGWEKFVLEGADWDRFRPTVVIVEATEPGTTIPAWYEWEPYLTENARYEMVYFDGLNRFYLRREYADLSCHFEVPPNVFDEFTLSATHVAEQAAEALRTERDSLARGLAEVEDKIKVTTAENLHLTELLHGLDTECCRTRASLEAVEQARQALERERDSLAMRLTELEGQTARHRDQIADLERQRNELDQTLLNTRLWVGRLSQDLVASKRR